MAEFTAEQISILDQAARLTVRALDNYMIEGEEVNLSAAEGTNDLEFPRVKQGRVLVLEHLSGYDQNSSPTRIRCGYYNGHANVWFKTVPAPIATETVEHNGRLLLRRGMFPLIRFEGCTANDDIHAMINGYTISA